MRAPVPSRWIHALALALLAALAVGLYARTLDDDWHFDDLGELTSTVRALSPHVSTDHYRGIVVLWLWALDFRRGGEDPAVYHATNLALHVAATACLYWLAALLAPAGRRRPWTALAVAAVFCAHPLATQSVAYVTQRSTSAAAFLFLLAVAAWVAGRRTKGVQGAALLALSLVAHGVGLYTKHVGVLVPVALLAYEMLFPVGGRRRVVLLLLPFLLLSGVRVAQYVPRLARSAPQFEVDDAARAMPRLSRRDYALSQPRSVAAYARLFVFLRGQNLDVDYAPVNSPASPAAWSPALILLAFAATAWSLRIRHPVVPFGVGLFFLALLPTSSVVTCPDVYFEHRAYLPMAGLCLALSPLLTAGARRHAAGTAAGVIVVVAVLALVTVRRLAVWDTELSLWGDTVAKSPGKARPHVNYALALQTAGRLQEAEAEYRRALDLRPEYPFAMNNLGNVRRRLGDPAEARRLMERAIEIRPGYVSPRLNLGNLAMDGGDAVDAERWYREAATLAPTAGEARYNLAKALERQGRYEEAIAEYEHARSLRPREALFANDLGCARLSAGDPAGAEHDLRAALALNPQWGVAWYNLGLALRAQQRVEDARAAFDRALAVAPTLEPARVQREALDAEPVPGSR